MAEVGPVEVATPAVPRTVRAAGRLPAWMGSIRFRLTLLYSSVLFGLAALLVGVIYLSLARSLEEPEVYRQVTVRPIAPGVAQVEEQLVVDAYKEIERRANERSLELLRNYSFGALGALFVLSLGVGWVVSGRVLAPIHRITAVAKDIQARDLSRRISLGGPNDELRELADTFDDMLDRIDTAFEGQRQFIHEASHELRNPLAVIRTNLDVTLADPDTSPEEYRETLDVVSRSVDRLSRLVDDLLVYARRGHLSPQRETVDVATVVSDVGAEFRAEAERGGRRLLVDAPAGLWVDGRAIDLRQALANLLANALRYAPAGTDVRARAGREGPWVWMSVEDRGPGISAEDQGRIFQRFWRGDPAEGRAEGRSGLGLTIVRQIAESHGGEVKVASTPGEGAAFAVWLPASPDPA